LSRFWSLDHLAKIPPIRSLGRDWWTLGKLSQGNKKRGGNFWFLSPVLLLLWITSYTCLSISANRGDPSICQ